MSVENAIITDVITLKPGQTVEEGMAVLEKHAIRAAPVLEENGTLLGMFSNHYILNSLLPVSVTMDDGLQNLDFVIGAAPGIAMRLRKLKPQKIETVIDRKTIVLHPQTPVWEAIRLVVKYGSPLCVIDEETGKFLGIMTEQSAISQLEQSIAEQEKAAGGGRKKK